MRQTVSLLWGTESQDLTCCDEQEDDEKREEYYYADGPDWKGLFVA